MKSAIKLLALLLLLAPFLLTLIPLTRIGAITLAYNGFAIDASEYVYVGTDNAIEVYHDGQLMRKIDTSAFRTYTFTIENGKSILLSNASRVYLMDLYGNVTDTWEDEGTSTFNRLQRIRTFKAVSGRQYTLKWRLLRTSIYCEDELVYQMPILDFSVRIFLFFYFTSLLIAIPYCILSISRYQYGSGAHWEDMIKDMFTRCRSGKRR